MTDFERSKVYAAEHTIAAVLDRGGTFNFHGSYLTLPTEYKFSSLEHVQMYVDKVLAFAPVIERFGVLKPIKVIEYHGHKKAEYRPPNNIAIPSKSGAWAMREIVVCHEIAHHIDYRCYGNSGHGPTFRSAMVDLVKIVISEEAALLLRTEFSDSGLRLAVVG